MQRVPSRTGCPVSCPCTILHHTIPYPQTCMADWPVAATALSCAPAALDPHSCCYFRLSRIANQKERRHPQGLNSGPVKQPRTGRQRRCEPARASSPQHSKHQHGDCCYRGLIDLQMCPISDNPHLLDPRTASPAGRQRPTPRGSPKPPRKPGTWGGEVGLLLSVRELGARLSLGFTEIQMANTNPNPILTPTPTPTQPQPQPQPQH